MAVRQTTDPSLVTSHTTGEKYSVDGREGAASSTSLTLSAQLESNEPSSEGAFQANLQYNLDILAYSALVVAILVSLFFLITTIWWFRDTHQTQNEPSRQAGQSGRSERDEPAQVELSTLTPSGASL
ncbi:hypothetical protein NUW58_g3790 [Xylaria curta]|uniref:Uncharacterized protein n=1 Tax=Xylaria curta TaxID=42375 RepID=A0ACC1PAT8_9PEZI|nr:hypothetical protein NUW58_g3790 [Xylaria curta]